MAKFLRYLTRTSSFNKTQIHSILSQLRVVPSAPLLFAHSLSHSFACSSSSCYYFYSRSPHTFTSSPNNDDSSYLFLYFSLLVGHDFRNIIPPSIHSSAAASPLLGVWVCALTARGEARGKVEVQNSFDTHIFNFIETPMSRSFAQLPAA